MARFWILLVLAAAVSGMPQFVEQETLVLDPDIPDDDGVVEEETLVVVEEGLPRPMDAAREPLLVLVNTEERVRRGTEEEEELDHALDELMQVVPEEELVEMLEQEGDPQAVEAVMDAMLRRVRRSPQSCEGRNVASPMCQMLFTRISQRPDFDGTEKISSSEFGDRDGEIFVTSLHFMNEGTFGDEQESGSIAVEGRGGEFIHRGSDASGDFVKQGTSSEHSSEFVVRTPNSERQEFSSGFSSSESSRTVSSGFSQQSGSSQQQDGFTRRSASAQQQGFSGQASGSQQSSGSAQVRFSGGSPVQLQPSYSHDECRPPVTHVVREAVEYLPKTVYNTQHLLLPSTRLLTMFETERYPQPHYITETSTIRLPDVTVTETLIQTERRTIDVAQPRETEFVVRSTKLHIFTDTRDYFWTKTEFTPYFVTHTQYITSTEPHEISNVETRVIGQHEETTTTIPHVITSTSTTTTVTRIFTTTTLHQYRYVTATPSAVTVTTTVTSCF